MQVRGDRWLTLKIFPRQTSEKRSVKPSWLFSVPKKIIKQAVRRNRIKRLLREAIREDDYFSDMDKAYFFSVKKAPGRMMLVDVKHAVDGLK